MNSILKGTCLGLGVSVIALVSIALSCATMLGLLFIGLKLGHVIAWSWLAVVSPFIVLAAAYIIGIVFACIVMVRGDW